MRTSLNNIKHTEDFLFGKLNPADTLLFRARLLLEPTLRSNVAAQRRIYTLIRTFGRKKVKSEIESIHEKIFADAEKISFRQKIARLFPKN